MSSATVEERARKKAERKLEKQRQAAFAAAKPIYETMPGWNEDISTPSCVVLLPVTCQPRAVNDSASGIPSHPKPTIATFFIPGS